MAGKEGVRKRVTKEWQREENRGGGGEHEVRYVGTVKG